MTDRALTPPKLAAMYGVSLRKIHVWIETGELQALNVATKPTDRPRWIVKPADLEVFELRRSSAAVAKLPTVRRRKPADEKLEFF